jgi:hypothetical protein
MRNIFTSAIVVLLLACANGTQQKNNDGGDSSPGSGASGGGGATGGGGSGGSSSLCALDCSAIVAPDCLQSVCNEGQYTGTVGQCLIVNADDGTACEDGEFCTANDTCVAGNCTAGPQNTCGMDPPACQQVTCNEATQECTLVPGANGTFCTPSNLCLVNATCLNGSCSGGQPKDCFFAPVPNECYVAVCNQMNGMCEPQPDPTKMGFPCVDQSDLCTVNKTCDAIGNCQGGVPKDCSAFTMGCNIGNCDTMTGNCFGVPVNNGDPCNDLDNCTVGELCNNGMCNGGTVINQCGPADTCCANGCTPQNDPDCPSCLNGDPDVNGACALQTVCNFPPVQHFCGGNCSSNHDQFAQWWCQLGGYSGAASYTVEDMGVVNCLYYNLGNGMLSSCAEVQGPSQYGLANFCTAVTDLLCVP